MPVRYEHEQVEMVPLAELRPYDGNAKRHTNEQVDAVEASIREFGFRNPVLAWHNDDGAPEIVAGHARCIAAIMQRMHDAHGESHLMARCVTSTLFGELADAAVFNFGMFLGALPVATILGTVVSFGLAKVAYEAAMYPITKQVIKRVKALE